jgi:hypothetical protein
VEFFDNAWNLALGAVATALSGGASGILIEKYKQRKRGLQEESSKEPVRPAEPLKTLGTLEQKLVSHFESLSREAWKNLTNGHKVEIYDFDAGWRVLFQDLFTSPTTTEKVLRDFSVTGHASLSFGKYDFETYPSFVRERLEELERLAGKDHGYKIRFLVLCDRKSDILEQLNLGHPNLAQAGLVQAALAQAVFAHAERFFCELLALKSSFGGSASVVDRFKEWRGDGGDPDIEIRICNRSVAKRLVVEGANATMPFNVYGENAVSISIVRKMGRVKPVPHLEIFMDRALIKAHKKLFDGLWSQSAGLQEKVFATPDKEVETLGNGDLFARWAELEA